MNPANNTLKITEIEHKIRSIISRTTGKPIEQTINNQEFLQIDSLAKLEIMTLLETEFKVHLTEDETSEFTSISKISRIIQRNTSLMQASPALNGKNDEKEIIQHKS
jgi:acyl carrier protein